MTGSNFKPGPQRDPKAAICPHCGHQDRDAWEYTQDDPCEVECGECEQPYIVWAHYSVTYCTKPKEAKS